MSRRKAHRFAAVDANGALWIGMFLRRTRRNMSSGRDQGPAADQQSARAAVRDRAEERDLVELARLYEPSILRLTVRRRASPGAWRAYGAFGSATRPMNSTRPLALSTMKNKNG
ncbi:MAG TPA: hypothetical protein VNO30_40485 [Kofleriaceae bacterium]|nr:hypothetical protein [Kofleriaceae bacterium]